MKRLLQVDNYKGAPNRAPARAKYMLSAALALSGCLKPGMSRMDTIRTGNGDTLRYMVPIAVKQEDGSGAYCVYVARPNSDMSFFENLGPGRTDGATPVTKNAIPQGEFIQNLRDPEIMKDLGGLGNDMVNDLFTAGSAWMLASAGLVGGAMIDGVRRSRDFGGFDKEAQKLIVGMLEADSINDSELRTAHSQLRALLVSKGAKPAVADRFIRVLASAKPASRGDGFYQAYLKRFAVMTGGQDLATLESQLGNLLRTPGMGNAKVTDPDIKTLRSALRVLQDLPPGSTEGLELNRVLSRISVLEVNGASIVRDIEGVKTSIARVGGAAPGVLKQTIEQSRTTLNSLSESFRTKFSQNTAGIYGPRNANQLNRVASGSVKLFGAGNGATYAAKEAAGRSQGILARKPSMDPDAAWNHLRAGLQQDQLGKAVGANVEDGVAAVASGGGVKNLFANACLRGSNGWVQVTKITLCGLAVGAGSFGVKKLLFEPATEPIKREQVAQSFEFTETVQEVNDDTFRRLEATIASFKSEATALSCQ